MIIRILGEGQFRIPDDAALAEINSADEAIEAALESEDETELQRALQGVHDAIIRVGSPLAVDELRGSDIIMPGVDATVAEVRELLGGDGLVPDSF
ncbi:PspA-associated protein PspAA [Propionibacteriaceae bacterium Y2011]|uniref:PspA-associated protein PspAA n=1 Tax=Microlunatus sp. Y2014 TaxID=3418488 RepID=UPI003B4C3056